MLAKAESRERKLDGMGGEKESLHFNIRYVQRDKLRSPLLRKAESNVIQTPTASYRMGNGVESVPRV